MLNKKIESAFNNQINAEMYSAYIYISMSAYFDSEDLQGMASWMRIQTQEEMTHAMKFFDFVMERGGRISLGQIEAPPAKWNSALDAFQTAYEHECKVSGMINELVDLSLSEKDHASNAFLQWFVSEQVEEEATALSIVNKLKLAGDHAGALFMIDKELEGRQVEPTE